MNRQHTPIQFAPLAKIYRPHTVIKNDDGDTFENRCPHHRPAQGDELPVENNDPAPIFVFLAIGLLGLGTGMGMYLIVRMIL